MSRVRTQSTLEQSPSKSEVSKTILKAIEEENAAAEKAKEREKNLNALDPKKAAILIYTLVDESEPHLADIYDYLATLFQPKDRRKKSKFIHDPKINESEHPPLDEHIQQYNYLLTLSGLSHKTRYTQQSEYGSLRARKIIEIFLKANNQVSENIFQLSELSQSERECVQNSYQTLSATKLSYLEKIINQQEYRHLQINDPEIPEGNCLSELFSNLRNLVEKRQLAVKKHIDIIKKLRIDGNDTHAEEQSMQQTKCYHNLQLEEFIEHYGTIQHSAGENYYAHTAQKLIFELAFEHHKFTTPTFDTKPIIQKEAPKPLIKKPDPKKSSSDTMLAKKSPTADSKKTDKVETRLNSSSATTKTTKIPAQMPPATNNKLEFHQRPGLTFSKPTTAGLSIEQLLKLSDTQPTKKTSKQPLLETIEEAKEVSTPEKMTSFQEKQNTNVTAQLMQTVSENIRRPGSTPTNPKLELKQEAQKDNTQEIKLEIKIILDRIYTLACSQMIADNEAERAAKHLITHRIPQIYNQTRAQLLTVVNKLSAIQNTPILIPGLNDPKSRNLNYLTLTEIEAIQNQISKMVENYCNQLVILYTFYTEIHLASEDQLKDILFQFEQEIKAHYAKFHNEFENATLLKKFSCIVSKDNFLFLKAQYLTMIKNLIIQCKPIISSITINPENEIIEAIKTFIHSVNKHNPTTPIAIALLAELEQTKRPAKISDVVSIQKQAEEIAQALLNSNYSATAIFLDFTSKEFIKRISALQQQIEELYQRNPSEADLLKLKQDLINEAKKYIVHIQPKIQNTNLLDEFIKTLPSPELMKVRKMKFSLVTLTQRHAEFYQLACKYTGELPNENSYQFVKMACELNEKDPNITKEMDQLIIKLKTDSKFVIDKLSFDNFGNLTVLYSRDELVRQEILETLAAAMNLTIKTTEKSIENERLDQTTKDHQYMLQKNLCDILKLDLTDEADRATLSRIYKAVQLNPSILFTESVLPIEIEMSMLTKRTPTVTTAQPEVSSQSYSLFGAARSALNGAASTVVALTERIYPFKK